MIDKLEAIKKRFEEVSQLIVQPDIIADMDNYAKLNKEYRDLEKVVNKYDEYLNVTGNIKNAKEVLETEKDEEFRDMAKAELDELAPREAELEEELKFMLIPKDPNDSKNVILEIRAGTGGDEAAIFAGDLYKMYQQYAQSQNWNFNIMSLTEGSAGGFKEIVISVEGEDVYAKLKFESGAHRVQRVPQTESQGRVHTSAATVAVLPEAEDVDVELNMGDIRKDTFRASGAGGQHINKTESAVRLTHAPSGLVVECQDGRSQHANYDKALKVLRSRLYEIELKKHNEAISSQRKTMVGSGDRSDKIRTYNYPQGRVTDHRINHTVYNLPNIMNGEIEEFIEKLRIAENTELLKAETQD
ncbi:peptide chain release factor 1 [Marinoscillum furvescens]|uniref:Peptide chain release factor 1 n=1 Tax=Marinoscillum furvescens DSM 4134 TaxID=1122208 RepID=A0A3D9KXZ2_MARFU|nr:peptide chain release factor 1 [Marinoscillum furvescens]RED94102.1 peptide chain release factor 1 (bRF-1) [Marinoscillum furvescens DSM 4134]